MFLTKKRQNEIDAQIDNRLLRLGMSYPEDNIFEIVNAMGIDVFFSDLSVTDKFKRVSGIIDYNEDNNHRPRIILNKSKSKERQTFTLAHELGHFILHKPKPGEIKFRIDKFDYLADSQECTEETEANYFAASFLVPELKLKSVLGFSNDGFNDFKKIGKAFGVSASVIETRVTWLKRNQ